MNYAVSDLNKQLGLELDNMGVFICNVSKGCAFDREQKLAFL
jgi:hypothetical protein